MSLPCYLCFTHHNITYSHYSIITHAHHHSTVSSHDIPQELSNELSNCQGQVLQLHNNNFT